MLPFFFSTTNSCSAALPVFAPDPGGCGSYEIAGRVERYEGSFVLVVNEGSQSEYQLGTQHPMPLEMGLHFQRWVKVRARLVSKPRAYRGLMEVQEIEDSLPNPLRPEEESGFRLLAKLSCR
jgi:hypothetical protein